VPVTNLAQRYYLSETREASLRFELTDAGNGITGLSWDSGRLQMDMRFRIDVFYFTYHPISEL
jgi:hypothetical protein